MFESRIMINDRNYVFVYKDGKMHLLRNKNGNFTLVTFDTLKSDEKNRILDFTVETILDCIKQDIEDKLKNGEYKNTDEIQKDIQNKIEKIDVPELQQKIDANDVMDSVQTKEYVKSMNDEFETLNQSVEKKEKIVEENLDIKLDALFKENGITEYDINKSATVVVYYKNGIPHTINNTDKKKTIYEAIISEIELDKMTSREQLDKALNDAMEYEAKYVYSANDTISTNELDKETQSLADNVRSDYDPTHLYGVSTKEPFQKDEMILSDFGNGAVPVFVSNSLEDGYAVKIGAERAIDNSKNITNERFDKRTENMERELNNYGVLEKLSEIQIKTLNNEELTEEEIDYVNGLLNEEIFEQLPLETRDKLMEILTYIDNCEKEYGTSKEQESTVTQEPAKVKKLGEHPKLGNTNNIITTLIVMFAIILTGVVTVILNFDI